ncbi:hypothetical protein [Colwellia sp. RSH04]|uniref:hypothetical protein n=1 Tax=Colwellia sp. RSH04 TaxID=2305464 RepID=UPI000E584163|nr:hypothetical protein [Colwellia sp. RSH04]RHW77450.1 hypothetical protein D1094_00375 [Colwellia sp. RSH04]
MRILTQFIVLVTISLVVSGCKVTPAKQVYTPPTTNKTINVYSLIPQDELEALYPVQNSSAATAQFGLVGALVGVAIDTSINKSNAEIAEENLVGIRNELLHLNFDKLFEEEIVKKLDTNINVGTIKTVKSYDELEKLISPNETYLVLNTHYKMDIDFRTPFIVTNVSLNQKGHGKGKTKVKDSILYKNTFTYFGLSLPAPIKTQAHIDAEVAKINEDFYKLSEKKQKSREARLKRQKKIKKARKSDLDFEGANKITAHAWSTEYKEELDVNLRNGIQQLFTLIANDIDDKTLPETYAKSGITLAGYPKYHKSILVEETDTRKVIRFSEGHRAGAICSMPKEESLEKLVCL